LPKADETPQIELNPALDRAALRETFERDRKIHIPAIFPDALAQRIHQCLTHEVEWNLVFNDGDKHHEIQPHQIAAMSAEDRGKLHGHVMAGAKEGFQYIYNNYPLADAYHSDHNPGLYLNRFYEFINSAEFLDFIRQVTGFEEVAFADSMATAYAANQFLSEHDDGVKGKNRLLAYVFNFTPYWRPDWGGILQFMGPDGHLETGLVPTFNALNMFAVPAPHSVSFVTPFAAETRYAITGWLRKGEPQWK
jgi:Rps23 Pro-64 3,4-dihydroxylase Tpa1-like proline 4-hydroxylase